MKQITSKEFKQAVNLDPAWASKLTEPVEITDFCDMIQSHITHLSPLLKFSGTDGRGNVANFSNCKNLKVAEGQFDGCVTFAYSEIEKIGDLKITGTDENGLAASFAHCKNLKVAEGQFPKFVSFKYSGIKKIGDLKITETSEEGWSAIFSECKNLKVAEGQFPGFVNFSGSGIEKIGDLKITGTDKYGNAATFHTCENLKVAEGQFPGYVSFRDSGIEKISDLKITEPHKQTKLFCNLTGTPFGEKNPTQSLETMTGTNKFSMWKEISENLPNHLEKTKSFLEKAILQNKKQEHNTSKLRDESPLEL